MLYVFFGVDEKKTRGGYDKLVGALLEKHKDASLVRLDGLSFDEENFKGFIFGQGLFSRRLIVTGNSLCEDKERAQFLVDNLEAINHSPNIFIFIEKNLSKDLIENLKNNAEKIVESSSLFKKEKKEFDLFPLLDAMGSRDRKHSWVLYEEALASGLSPEEIFWRLSWQIKAISLASFTQTAEEADMKVFPYNKSKKFSRNFKEEELRKISEKITNIYHRSRDGGDMNISIEQLVLNI